jgi:hypothetical protein
LGGGRGGSSAGKISRTTSGETSGGARSSLTVGMVGETGKQREIGLMRFGFSVGLMLEVVWAMVESAARSVLVGVVLGVASTVEDVGEGSMVAGVWLVELCMVEVEW